MALSASGGVAEVGAAAGIGAGIGSTISGIAGFIISKVFIPVGIILVCDNITAVHTDPGELTEEDKAKMKEEGKTGGAENLND